MRGGAKNIIFSANINPSVHRGIYIAKYYGGGGGNGCWEKKLKLRVWGKNEKEGKRGKEKKGLKTHL